MSDTHPMHGVPLGERVRGILRDDLCCGARYRAVCVHGMDRGGMVLTRVAGERESLDRVTVCVACLSGTRATVLVSG